MCEVVIRIKLSINHSKVITDHYVEKFQSNRNKLKSRISI